MGGIGTLTINGALTFNSGSTYAVTVSPLTASNTIVTGTASLTGGTVQATYQASTHLAKQYTILQSGGLGGTQFAGLVNTNLPTGFQASLDYSTPTAVMLDLTTTLGALPQSGLTINRQNVAGALKAFFNNGGTLPPGFVTVFGLSSGNLANALSQLSGEGANGAQQAGFQLPAGRPPPSSTASSPAAPRPTSALARCAAYGDVARGDGRRHGGPRTPPAGRCAVLVFN